MYFCFSAQNPVFMPFLVFIIFHFSNFFIKNYFVRIVFLHIIFVFLCKKCTMLPDFFRLFYITFTFYTLLSRFRPLYCDFLPLLIIYSYFRYHLHNFPVSSLYICMLHISLKHIFPDDISVIFFSKTFLAAFSIISSNVTPSAYSVLTIVISFCAHICTALFPHNYNQHQGMHAHPL